MKICTQCNNKFGIMTRIKSFNRAYGEIQCENCKSTYRQTRRFYKPILIGIATYWMITGGNNKIILATGNSVIGALVWLTILYISSLCFDLMAYKLYKYEKYN